MLVALTISFTAGQSFCSPALFALTPATIHDGVPALEATRQRLPAGFVYQTKAVQWFGDPGPAATRSTVPDRDSDNTQVCDLASEPDGHS